MTDWMMQTNVSDAQILSRRLGAFLQGRGTIKQLALKLDCDERTMKNIRAGLSWPIARHWLSIWLEFGDDVLEAVFKPELAEARLQREALEREQARQRRLASLSLEHRYFGPVAGAGEALGSADEELDRDPLTLDLFEAPHV